ncbi:MAG: P-II family nitrogen regulator [Brevinematales bacterium]
MKRIEAIIRPEKMDAVVEKLGELGYPGLNYTEVQGHGRQKGMKEIFRGREYDVKFVPKIKIEIVVKDDQADKILEAIIKVSQTGQIGDGKIFVSEVLDAIRVRTEERGDEVL